jgi:hypothetical protein
MPKKAKKQTVNNLVDGNAVPANAITPEQWALVAQLLTGSAPTPPVAMAVAQHSVHPFVNVLAAELAKRSAARRSSFATSVGLLQSEQGKTYVMPTFEVLVRICLDGVNDFSDQGSLKTLFAAYNKGKEKDNQVKSLKKIIESVNGQEVSLLLNAVK